MKKYIGIMLVVIACLAMTASVVLAATDFTTGNSTVLGSVVFTPSTNVTVSVMSNNQYASSDPNMYCVESWHSGSINQGSGRRFAAISGGGTSTSSQNTAIVTATIPYTSASAIPRCTAVTAWPDGFTAPN